MDKPRVTLLCLFFTLGLIACTQPAPRGPQCDFVTTQRPSFENRSPSQAEYVPGEIVVKYRSGSTPESVDLNAYGSPSIVQRTSGDEVVLRMSAQPESVNIYDLTMAAVASLQADPNVEYAEPNWIFHAHDLIPNDTCYPDQWHYRNFGTGADQSPGGIDLPQAWDDSTGSNTVVVAVLDTGIVASHPDLGPANSVPGFDMISNAGNAADGDGRDPDPTDPGDAQQSFHGTHVAGTVGIVGTNNNGGVAGVNWSVSVQSVRVLGTNGGSFVDINDAIRWAAGLPVPGVPNNSTPSRVINMSLGSAVSCPAAQQAAINDATAAGALVVVSAGNDGQNAAGFAPAGCDNVFTIAASGRLGRLAPYSNHTAVDILAPGGDTSTGEADGVLSTVNGGYAFFQGTSMAAPHVSGVAALVLATDPSLTPSALQTKIMNNTRPRNSTQCPRPCGAGLLNAHFP